MLKSLFKPRPAQTAGKALYAAAAHQARDATFYASLGVPDTGEGRFELYVLHVALLVRRLKGQGDVAAETSQALFDTFVRSLDDGLREMGVGDLVVGKRMRKLAEAFYGRLRAFDEALGRLPDLSELEGLLGRTVLQAAPADGAPQNARLIADYVRRAVAHLERLPLDGLLGGETSWPEVMHGR